MSKTMKLTAEEYLKHSQNDVAKALDRVITEFDFRKAARALKGCGWKYQGASTSPTADELKTIAIDIVRDVINSGSGCSIHSGPLKVSTRHYNTPAVVTVTLSLVPAYSSAVYIDGRVIFAKKQVRLDPAPQPSKSPSTER